MKLRCMEPAWLSWETPSILMKNWVTAGYLRREGEDAQVARVDDRDPVLHVVRRETVLLDEDAQPVHRLLVQLFRHVLRQAVLLLVLPHLHVQVQDRPELLVSPHDEEQTRIVDPNEFWFEFAVQVVVSPCNMSLGRIHGLIQIELRIDYHFDRVPNIPATSADLTQPAALSHVSRQVSDISERFLARKASRARSSISFGWLWGPRLRRHTFLVSKPYCSGAPGSHSSAAARTQTQPHLCPSVRFPSASPDCDLFKSKLRV